ncbi:MAG: GFA family protein [Deltaproteobacteria bacterium]|nr:GFA family protein [Deltaproteobacteria bacterium]
MSTKRQHSAGPPFEGGCACGKVRYRMTAEPMFVHCCHCTRCQRETGGPFAHHAMIEFSRFEVTLGEPAFVLVPTDSGGKHWVARCPACRTAMWNEHGTRQAVTRYVRVGTLDAPAALPPRAHIFVRSKQPWVVVPDDAPSFRGYYDAAKTWPAESLARYAAAKALRAEEAEAERLAKPKTAAKKPTPTGRGSKSGRPRAK